MRGSTFLDGCAGVGAIGIEAISRGAAMVVFVDQARNATGMIRENLQSLGIEKGFKILESDLAKALGVCVRDGMTFDVAFVDPPYGREHIYKDALEKTPLTDDGLLILEHSKRAQMPEKAGKLRQVRMLQQGDSVLSFYRPEVE